VEAKITITDNEHASLKNANFMLDVRIPTKKRKITLTDLYELVVDLKVRVIKIEDTLIRNNIR
jgi:hypothetical protein